MNDNAGPLRLRLESGSEPNAWIVVGELDSHSVDLVGETVRGPDGAVPAAAVVCLDMSAVGFIDSSGLRTLVELQGELVDRGGSLQLDNPSEVVRRVLDLTGLADHFGLQ